MTKIKTRIFEIDRLQEKDWTETAVALEAGAVAALPTDTVYGLATGGRCAAAIERICLLKQRPVVMPLQILVGSMQVAEQVAVFSPEARRLCAEFWPGGLTLVLPATAEGSSLLRGFAGLGLRYPGNPFLGRLLGGLQSPLACTSANLHGEPVVTDEKTLLETFDGKVDFIFLGGTLAPTASSVVDLTGMEPVLLREGTLGKPLLEKALGRPLLIK